MLEYVISTVALSIGVVIEPLLHFTFPCLDIPPYPSIELGSSSSLAMLSRVISCHLREIGSVVGSRLAIFATVGKELG